MSSGKQLSIIDEIENILSISSIDDKYIEDSKEQTYKGMKPSNKVKILRIPVDESILEGNLIELPFISYYKEKEPLTVIEYVWKDSKGIEKKIEVRGSKWGVPDEYCFDVLTALFRIHVKQNKCVEFDIEEKKWNMDKTIHFSLSELAREMGYKSLGKNVFDKIDIALEILNDTTIYNKAGCSFLDIKEKEYLTAEKKESTRIVTNYKSYRYSKLRQGQKRVNYREIKEMTSVVIDDFIYESLCNSYFKIFNYEEYRQLKMGIAKKIYLLLNKWRAKRKRIFLTWETLYQKIPLTDKKTEKYRKKRIREACKKLISIDYIREINENKSGLEFVFIDGIEESITEPNQDVKKIENSDDNKYNTIYDILMALNDVHMDSSIVQKILSEVDMNKIRETLMNIEGKNNDKKRKELESLI